METYKVAPFDQNLWVHGKYLTDPTKTLGQLRILPKSLIYLRADEPNLPGITSTGRIEEDTSWVVPQHDPEEGFKGNFTTIRTIRLNEYIKPSRTPWTSSPTDKCFTLLSLLGTGLMSSST